MLSLWPWLCGLGLLLRFSLCFGLCLGLWCCLSLRAGFGRRFGLVFRLITLFFFSFGLLLKTLPLSGVFGLGKIFRILRRVISLLIRFFLCRLFGLIGLLGLSGISWRSLGLSWSHHLQWLHWLLTLLSKDLKVLQPRAGGPGGSRRSQQRHQ